MPEIIPIHATLHYKCAIDIEPREPAAAMTRLRATLRDWSRRKAGRDPGEVLRQPWFLAGNSPGTGPAQHVVDEVWFRTAAAPGPDPASPRAWALEAIHPDAAVVGRRWSVEVMLHRRDDRLVRFSTIVRHWMQPYFLGPAPEPPTPSTPRYVRDIVEQHAFVCRRGSTTVRSRPEYVTAETAAAVYDELAAPDRLLPVVLLAHDPDTDQPPVDPVELNRLVLGNANVYVLTGPGVVDEMNYYLGPDYRCEAGAVRVYVPTIDRHNPHNHRQHRFLARSQVARDGAAAVTGYLVNGLSRYGRTFRPGEFTSLTHIFAERRRYALHRLAAEGETRAGEVARVFAENQKLRGDVDELEQVADSYSADIGLLKGEAGELENLAGQYAADAEALRQENGTLRHRIETAEQLRDENAALKDQIVALREFASLPTNLDELLAAFARLHPDRLACAPEAHAVAADYSHAHASHWQRAGSLAVAWEMLHDLAVRLHRIVFEQNAPNLEDVFNAASTFELAMGEGSKTKKDGKLMKLRSLVFDGKEWDISPHLKYGTRKPKLLRLYFDIDRERKRFVVGHFGDHLDNATTKKL